MANNFHRYEVRLFRYVQGVEIGWVVTMLFEGQPRLPERIEEVVEEAFPGWMLNDHTEVKA